MAEEVVLELVEAPTCTVGGIGNVKGLWASSARLPQTWKKYSQKPSSSLYHWSYFSPKSVGCLEFPIKSAIIASKHSS